MVIPKSTDANPVINRASIDTTTSVRSIMDSILSLYGHESLYERPSDYQSEALETGSMITEDHMRKSTVVDHDGPDSPLILPCASEYPLDSSTRSNNEAIGDLELENFDHLAATESGIPTEFYEFGSNQFQYDSERAASGFPLRNTRATKLRQSYDVVLSIMVNDKYGHYTLCTFLAAAKISLHCSRLPMKTMWRIHTSFASTVRSKI